MKVIITGAAGRLGSYLVNELIRHKFEVSAVDTVLPPDAPCEICRVDLMDFVKLRGSFAGCDAIVHLARKRFPYTESGFNAATQLWDIPDVAGDAERFNHNVSITYNVLAAAHAAGVRKLICGSSLAVYGFYYPIRKMTPDYLPVDEAHPRRPQDPYGISKLVGEDLCAAFARKSDMQIASLRFSGIYTEAHRAMLLERKQNPTIRGTGALWSYIEARDAATACRLALETDFKGHEALNICAPESITDTPTEDLLRRYLPELKTVREGLEGNWCGYDTSKAAATLGFHPRHLFRNGSLQ
jgi:nucleoside-diphosphate-sugar epimerase